MTARFGFPINLAVRDRRCVVVGGGEEAALRVLRLRDAGADLVVVTPRPCADLVELLDERVSHRPRAWRPSDLDGAILVIGTREDPLDAQHLHDEAKARGALVNVLDDVERCDYAAMSQVVHGDFQLSIATNGRAPAVAKLVRKRLEATFGPEWGELVGVVDEAKRELGPRQVGFDEWAERWSLALADADTLLASLRAGERQGVRAHIVEVVRGADGGGDGGGPPDPSAGPSDDGAHAPGPDQHPGASHGSNGTAPANRPGAMPSGGSSDGRRRPAPANRPGVMPSGASPSVHLVADPPTHVEPRSLGDCPAGVVHLVGAGPGDPELLTVRAARLLSAADLVVHDQLVPPSILALAGPRAEVVAAGRRLGHVVLPHHAVVELLADAARRGRRVVRLKGGDPVVFGRGTEEALELAERGVAAELVPGISSAVAAPELAGIPLTHRGVSAGFLVVTGQHATSTTDLVDWELAARFTGTLVVLMGATRLQQLAADLRRHGRSAGTPAAIVERAGHPQQRVVTGTLADLADRAEAAGVGTPSVVVIGEVVRLRAGVQEVLRSDRVAVDMVPAGMSATAP